MSEKYSLIALHISFLQLFFSTYVSTHYSTIPLEFGFTIYLDGEKFPISNSLKIPNFWLSSGHVPGPKHRLNNQVKEKSILVLFSLLPHALAICAILQEKHKNKNKNTFEDSKFPYYMSK